MRKYLKGSAPASESNSPPLREQGLWAFASIIAGYMLCSSCLLIFNKLAVISLPAPCFVLGVQLSCSAVVSWLVSKTTVPLCLSVEKTKQFLPVPILFLAALYFNIKTLQHSNVETFIVFRACTPVILAPLDACILGREFPSKWSIISIIIMLCGATGYTLSDAEFNVRGYGYLGLWFIVFIVDMLGKCNVRVLGIISRNFIYSSQSPQVHDKISLLV